LPHPSRHSRSARRARSPLPQGEGGFCLEDVVNMKAGVIVFPGSNCDRDAAVALQAATGSAPSMVWHGDSAIPASDLIVLPGGFSYGDYLRSGAMAAHSPVMREVVAHAKAGTPVLGICNGFQVLHGAGWLSG